MNDWHDAEDRVEKAQELFEQRKWQEALDELRAATSINPYNSSWFFNIGLTLDELGRFEEAVDAYRQATRINSEDLQAMNHLGVDLFRTGRLDQALQAFEAIEASDPSFEPTYCNRIIIYADIGEHDKAEEMFYLARLYKEHCPHCYHNIGCSLSARGLHDKAIFCWKKVLDLDETYPQIHVRIAEALWDKGDLEEARRHYLTALRQDPGDTDTLLDLGDLLMDAGRLEEAGEKFRRAIEMSPEYPAGYYCQGRWLLEENRDEEAIHSFSKALQLDPTYLGAHFYLAKLHYRRRDIEQTRQHLRHELLLRPDDPRMLLDLSNLMLDVGQSRAAVACLRRLIQIQPAHVSGWQNLAVAQFARGRYEEGMASCRQSLKHEPGNLMAIYNLALACEHLGQYDEAMQWVGRGLECDPADASLQKLQFRIRVVSFWARVIGRIKGLVS